MSQCIGGRNLNGWSKTNRFEGAKDCEKGVFPLGTVLARYLCQNRTAN